MKKRRQCESLIEIGLQNYLTERGGGSINEERHMTKIDSFIRRLPTKQRMILKDKINKKSTETHIQHNDVFHEVSIACAFYNNVRFLPETNKMTPDFCSNGTYVEVKTINNSDIERKRLDQLTKRPICSISPILSRSRVEQIKEEFIKCVGKKFKDHIKRARKQLGSNGGHVWVVYAIDRPPKFREHKDVRKKIENEFDNITRTLSTELNKSRLDVKYIYFEDLRKKIANQS